MNAWISNTLIDLKLTFRDRQALFWSYLFPLFFLFLFATIFGRGNPKAVTNLMPGMLSISAMAAGFFGLSIGLVSLRERGMLRRYKLAPIHPWLIMSSQLVSNFVVAISALLLQLALARMIYHIEIKGSFSDLLIMLSVGALAFLSLGFIIAGVAESTKVALVMANVLFYPLMFLGGAALPVQMLSPALRKVSRLLPSNFMVEGLGQIMVDGVGLGSVIVHLAVLAVTFAVALFIAAKLFRWEASERLAPAKKAWVAVIVLIFVGAGLWLRQ
jgi:ABC-2 type transport system permease protein